MKTFLLASQYLEDYETRFKPKGGRNFVVDAPCYYTALALVQRFLFTEQHDLVNEFKSKNQILIPSCEFPIRVDYPVEYENASHAIGEIPEWERDENVRLVWRGAGDDTPTEHDSPARLEQVNELPDQEY